MIKKLTACLLFVFLFASNIHGFESIEGEATGVFPELRGSGQITFITTGGEARLLTTCGDMTGTGANSVTCKGIDVQGTFSGGPNGTAVFNTESGEIKLQLKDGKVFSFSAQGISMDFNVTDPSIFDSWNATGGARDSGARMSSISGQLEIACPPDLEAWDVMKMGRVIYVDCHLKTGEDSTAEISFSDMTSFKMKPETEIVIDTPPEKDSKWKLLVGNIWVNVKQMVKDGTMKVHMSQAVAGIKGTTFELIETGSESTIKVIEGVVNFESLATGAVVDVSSGEMVTATSVGLSEKTRFDPSLEEKNLPAKSSPIEKESVGAKNPSSIMIYLVGAGVMMLIMSVAGVTVFKKKKTGQLM